MEYAAWNELRLSKLMLGTVQLGMPYGIANKTGQPNYNDVVKIIAAAIDGGTNCFDTAASYGTSEEILGCVLKELGIADDVTVVTKVRALTPEELADRSHAVMVIKQSIELSRRRLKLDCLPIVLFHREADAEFIDVLAGLKDEGKLSHVGVSCDNSPGPALEFVTSGRASALQLPANILDHRHLRSGVLEQAKSRSIAIFARSVYLQGLLVMAEGQIPSELAEIIPALRTLQAIADVAGMPLKELALRYLLSQTGITSVLAGVETAQQVIDNLNMFSRGPLPEEVLSAIGLASIQISETLLTPSMWTT